MGKRSRRRAAGTPGLPEAGESTYTSPGGDRLALREVMTLATRREYAGVLGGGIHQEDAWQRAVEFLFERLVVGWESAGVRYSGQKDLLARFRAASGEERRWVRDVLREHLAEWFPDVEAP
jgi:hypothetical protein